MATVTKQTTTKQVMQEVEIPEYVLTLSQDEAQALIEVCARVGTHYLSDHGQSRGQMLIEGIGHSLRLQTGTDFHQGVTEGGLRFVHENDPQNLCQSLLTKDQ